MLDERQSLLGPTVLQLRFVLFNRGRQSCSGRSVLADAHVLFGRFSVSGIVSARTRRLEAKLEHGGPGSAGITSFFRPA